MDHYCEFPSKRLMEGNRDFILLIGRAGLETASLLSC